MTRTSGHYPRNPALTATRRATVRRLEEGNQIGAVTGLGDAGKGHADARHHDQRLAQELIERFFISHNARFLHGRGIVGAGHAAGASAEQAAMPGPDAIESQRVAGCATRIQLVAARGVRCGMGDPARADGRQCEQSHRREMAAQNHAMKAQGTGTSPIAWRRMAQCMASSPKILAAALARSRLPNSGTAPR